MRPLRESTIKVTVLLILTGCYGHSGVIEVNKKQIGGLYEINDSGKEYRFYNSDEIFKLDTLTFISFADFDKIVREESQHEGVYSLGFTLNQAGVLKFKEMTGRNIGKPVCFVIGDKVMAAPTVQVAIPNGQGSITVADKKAIEEMIEDLKN